MRRLFVCLALLVLFVPGSLSAQQEAMPLLDRSKLPAAARNLPLQRLSTGALTLLNRENMLVAPRSLSANGTASAQAAESAPVALDLRVGANIRLGNDPPQLPAIMRAQAEPDIARSVTTADWLVATFQEGRFVDGGAVDVGYSTSHDGGLTWTRALLPSLTQTFGGPYFRATDPVVAFDTANDAYISTEAATDSQFANGVIVVSKSSNGGVSFAPPVVVYWPPNNDVFPDKDWMAVNTFPSTPHFGRIVVTWTLFSNTQQNVNPIVLSYSDNGGASFTPFTYVTTPGSSVQGSQPVFLPNGNLVVVYWNFGSTGSPGERLEAVISTDGGVTFGSPHLITPAIEWNEPKIRSGGFLPSATVDPVSGAIFVVYQTVLSGSPRIAFTKSLDGGFTWSAPISTSNNPASLGVFNSAIGTSPGGHTLSAVFYDHRDNPQSLTLVNLYLAQSFDGGATWQPNIRLTSVSTDATLAPLTPGGYMLGDYLGVAQSTMPVVPAVPVWVDTRTGNPDPFVTRVGIAPYMDFATAWEAARLPLSRVPATSVRLDSSDFDRDGEDNVSEAANGTNPLNAASFLRSGKETNISTRLHVETGDRVGIGGFVVSGTSSKSLILRALGPSLAAFGVPDVLQDPTISVYDSQNHLIAFDDNWRDAQAAQIQASGLAPGDNREAALAVTLAPGSYTAIVRGAGNTTGSALLELYDLNPGATAVLSNLSMRASVETGSFVPIAGLVVGAGRGTNGDGSSEVLVRAIGPELTAFGVVGALQDPVLYLYDVNGNLLASNDNWNTSIQAGAIAATGLAPKDTRESAILTTLVQGNWTAILRGSNNTTGVGLVEVYRIH